MKYLCFILFYLLSLVSKAQVITTFAGGGTMGLGDGGVATGANIANPNGGAFDKLGNYYVASNLSGNRIRKVSPFGIISTVAGNGIAGYGGDGGAATLAQLNQPTAVTVDTAGNIYIAEAASHRIRKVEIATGNIVTFAGNGSIGFYGDGGQATAAALNNPQDICFDKLGNLYIADYNNSRVRKVNSAGIITTFVGNGVTGYSGDGSKADTSKIGGVFGLCTDIFGNVYIADASNSRIFKINTTGIITTIAGTNAGYLFSGDNIPATSANIHPTRITADMHGNIFIADHLNYRIWQVDKFGIIHTIAGNGIAGHSGDGGVATSASFNYAAGLALDSCGNLYIAEANKCVRKVTFPKCHYLNVNETLQEAKVGINVFPNPANKELTITAPEEIKSVSVVDMVGREASPRPSPREREVLLNIQHLPAGVYVVRVNGVYFRKFVKE